MRAPEVYLNGKRLCTAGISDDGLLNTMVDHFTGNGRDDVHLRVGGLISGIDEHLTWVNLELRIGDEVRVKVIESAKADKPAKRHRRDPIDDKKQTKRYVRSMAKELGWHITTRKPK